MENKSFKELLHMIENACCSTFRDGARDEKKTMIECATQIYIAQMKGSK